MKSIQTEVLHRLTAAPKDGTAYQWYSYSHSTPLMLTSAKGTKLRLEKGSKFGVRNLLMANSLG